MRLGCTYEFCLLIGGDDCTDWRPSEQLKTVWWVIGLWICAVKSALTFWYLITEASYVCVLSQYFGNGIWNPIFFITVLMLNIYFTAVSCVISLYFVLVMLGNYSHNTYFFCELFSVTNIGKIWMRTITFVIYDHMTSTAMKRKIHVIVYFGVHSYRNPLVFMKIPVSP